MIEKEYIYPGAIKNIEKVLPKIKAKNILLVRGNQSFIKSGAKEALIPVYDKYNVVEFSDFSVNPKLEEARVGFDLYKTNNIDVIIAVGGGSVIDTAKIIKYLAIQENSQNADIPFVVAPTTAGTGSEATHFAVVYINRIKDSWAHQALIPTVAIVDANLLNGQSKYQIAVSGLDALAQGIESFWSVNSTDESRRYSEKAIKLMWENLEGAVNGNKEALKKITKGSNWAGKAINISKTTAAHALSYGFTSELGLPHGHAVALTLPYFYKTHYDINKETCNDPRGPNHVKEIMKRINNILNLNYNTIEIDFIKFFNNIGVDIDRSKLKISGETLSLIIDEVNLERLANNPLKINKDKLYNYLIK